MKSLSKRLTFMNLLFVLASNIHDGETAVLNYSRFDREDVYPDIFYLHRQNPNPNQPEKKERISKKKCKEYIEELRYKKPTTDMGTGVNDVLSFTEIGGRDAFPGEFPHMGGLGWRTINRTWMFLCGSTLISDKFSLTAAHCTKIPPHNDIHHRKPEIVRLNTNVIDESFSFDFQPVDVYIRRIIVHPDYTSPIKYYDIALIEHKRKIWFTRNLHPACLWTSYDMRTLGPKVMSTGWGTVDPVNRVTSSMLQVIEIDTIDSKECDNLLKCNRHWCRLREHQMCAGNLTGGIDSCYGDSGGPLQVMKPSHKTGYVTMHYLVGVTSFGLGCGRQNLPGVYTRVSSFIDWIECNVWKE